jgi:hypothetical protein
LIFNHFVQICAGFRCIGGRCGNLSGQDDPLSAGGKKMKKIHVGLLMAASLVTGCAGFTGQGYVDDLNKADLGAGRLYGSAGVGISRPRQFRMDQDARLS